MVSTSPGRVEKCEADRLQDPKTEHDILTGRGQDLLANLLETFQGGSLARPALSLGEDERLQPFFSGSRVGPI